MAGRPVGAENKNKRFKAALIRYADADPKRLDEMAEKLWLTAMEGDVPAMREVMDRLDGKVPQAIGGSDELDPIEHMISWKTTSKSITSPASNSSPSTIEPSASPASSAIDGQEKQ